MPCRTVDPRSATPAELGAWADLASRAAEPNPFLEPGTLVPALALPHAAGVGLLVVEDGDGWQAAMAVIKRRWRGLPPKATASWRHPYTYLGTPLVAADRVDTAVPALLSALRATTGLVAFEQLSANGPVATALGDAARERGLRTMVWDRHERAFLHRREDGRYVEAHLRSKRRRELRRQRDRLAEKLGGELTTTDRADDPAAVDAFLRLEAEGWKGRNGTALAVAGADTFFRAVCERFRAQDRLQLLALEGGGRTVAMKCNLLAGDGAFCFKIAYEESLAQHSPGVQLELDNVAAFHERSTVAWMDSCAAPHHPMIDRLWPDRRPITTILLAGASPAGQAVLAPARTARAIRARLKERNAA